jgi:hypothetical protein
LVLQFCAADDQRSVFNAARAHSKLHLAAVAAPRSITAECKKQKHVGSVLRYLKTHGQNVDSIDLTGDTS